jgi:exopolysaccharide biosynthesis protein
LEYGCHEAFTLDGGQTAAMVFLGEEVMDPGIYNGFQQARKQQDVIGIGQSDQTAK